MSLVLTKANPRAKSIHPLYIKTPDFFNHCIDFAPEFDYKVKKKGCSCNELRLCFLFVFLKNTQYPNLPHTCFEPNSNMNQENLWLW